jgi:hypothetical protein
LRTSWANQKAKSPSIMRTRGAHQEVIDVLLDGPIGS